MCCINQIEKLVELLAKILPFCRVADLFNYMISFVDLNVQILRCDLSSMFYTESPNPLQWVRVNVDKFRTIQRAVQLY